MHFQQFLDSPNYTPEALVRFLNSCHAHAEYLAEGRKFTRNNWGLMEAERVDPGRDFSEAYEKTLIPLCQLLAQILES